MSDRSVIGYFVVGCLCAVAVRILLRRLKIEPTRYWSILLGEGTEAIIFTVLLWPVTLAGIVLFYLLKQAADRYDTKIRLQYAERLRKERENPKSAWSLDELLQKVEEQKQKTAK